jgi:anti-repressor protein
MEELITISEQNGQNVVSARELYTFLEIKTDFTNWCKRMFEYGFENEVDYSLVKIGEGNAHNKTDYALTLDTSKEISMLQRSEKGKKARKYFIECEKKLLEIAHKPKELSRKELALIVIEQEEKLELLQKQIKHNEVKVKFVDRIIASEDMIDIGQCAKVLELPFGRNILFRELREKGIFFKNKNEPKQAFIERGYFKLKETFIETNTHGTISVIKVLVTQRGLGYLSTLFESVPSPKKLKKIT